MTNAKTVNKSARKAFDSSLKHKTSIQKFNNWLSLTKVTTFEKQTHQTLFFTLWLNLRSI